MGVKDTNPDHYKVDGADFITYMDDPQIKCFGDWMFANGFNMGEMQATNWIECKYAMPEERESVFARFKGTDKWTNAMFEKSSEDVRIVEEFEDNVLKSFSSFDELFQYVVDEQIEVVQNFVVFNEDEIKDEASDEDF